MSWDIMKQRLMNAVRNGGGVCTITVTLTSGINVTGVIGGEAPIANWSTDEIHVFTERRSSALFRVIAVSEIAMYAVHQ